MNCPSCGKPVHEGDSFCRNCGAPLPKDSPASNNGFAGNQGPDSVAHPLPKREETWQEKYLTARGRLNRKRYILRSLFLYVIAFILTFFIGILVLLLTGPGGMDGVTVVLQLLFGVLGAMLGIRRLHDLGHSGWWWLLAFVPVLNFILGIYLIFFKGETGLNRFGPDPLQ